MEKYHKFNKYKSGKYYRYKYSPDDVVFRLEKIVHATPEKIELQVYWLGAAILQNIVITKDSIEDYEECI